MCSTCLTPLYIGVDQFICQMCEKPCCTQPTCMKSLVDDSTGEVSSLVCATCFKKNSQKGEHIIVNIIEARLGPNTRAISHQQGQNDSNSNDETMLDSNGQSIRSSHPHTKSRSVDPYAVLRYQGVEYRTRVRPKTHDPIWMHHFKLHMSTTARTLDIMVYDHNSFGKHECLGQVKIPFAHLQNRRVYDDWFALFPTREGYSRVGPEGSLNQGIGSIHIQLFKVGEDEMSPMDNAYLRLHDSLHHLQAAKTWAWFSQIFRYKNPVFSLWLYLFWLFSVVNFPSDYLLALFPLIFILIALSNILHEGVEALEQRKRRLLREDQETLRAKRNQWTKHSKAVRSTMITAMSQTSLNTFPGDDDHDVKYDQYGYPIRSETGAQHHINRDITTYGDGVSLDPGTGFVHPHYFGQDGDHDQFHPNHLNMSHFPRPYDSDTSDDDAESQARLDEFLGVEYNEAYRNQLANQMSGDPHSHPDHLSHTHPHLFNENQNYMDPSSIGRQDQLSNGSEHENDHDMTESPTNTDKNRRFRVFKTPVRAVSKAAGAVAHFILPSNAWKAARTRRQSEKSARQQAEANQKAQTDPNSMAGSTLGYHSVNGDHDDAAISTTLKSNPNDDSDASRTHGAPTTSANATQRISFCDEPDSNVHKEFESELKSDLYHEAKANSTESASTPTKLKTNQIARSESLDSFHTSLHSQTQTHDQRTPSVSGMTTTKQVDSLKLASHREEEEEEEQWEAPLSMDDAHSTTISMEDNQQVDGRKAGETETTASAALDSTSAGLSSQIFIPPHLTGHDIGSRPAGDVVEKNFASSSHIPAMDVSDSEEQYDTLNPSALSVNVGHGHPSSNTVVGTTSGSSSFPGLQTHTSISIFSRATASQTPKSTVSGAGTGSIVGSNVGSVRSHVRNQRQHPALISNAWDSDQSSDTESEAASDTERERDRSSFSTAPSTVNRLGHQSSYFNDSNQISARSFHHPRHGVSDASLFSPSAANRHSQKNIPRSPYHGQGNGHNNNNNNNNTLDDENMLHLESADMRALTSGSGPSATADLSRLGPRDRDEMVITNDGLPKPSDENEIEDLVYEDGEIPEIKMRSLARRRTNAEFTLAMEYLQLQNEFLKNQNAVEGKNASAGSSNPRLHGIPSSHSSYSTIPHQNSHLNHQNTLKNSMSFSHTAYHSPGTSVLHGSAPGSTYSHTPRSKNFSQYRGPQPSNVNDLGVGGAVNAGNGGNANVTTGSGSGSGTNGNGNGSTRNIPIPTPRTIPVHQAEAGHLGDAMYSGYPDFQNQSWEGETDFTTSSSMDTADIKNIPGVDYHGNDINNSFDAQQDPRRKTSPSQLIYPANLLVPTASQYRKEQLSKKHDAVVQSIPMKRPTEAAINMLRFNADNAHAKKDQSPVDTLPTQPFPQYVETTRNLFVAILMFEFFAKLTLQNPEDRSIKSQLQFLKYGIFAFIICVIIPPRLILILLGTYLFTKHLRGSRWLTRFQADTRYDVASSKINPR